MDIELLDISSTQVQLSTRSEDRNAILPTLQHQYEHNCMKLPKLCQKSPLYTSSLNLHVDENGFLPGETILAHCRSAYLLLSESTIDGFSSDYLRMKSAGHLTQMYHSPQVQMILTNFRLLLILDQPHVSNDSIDCLLSTTSAFFRHNGHEDSTTSYHTTSKSCNDVLVQLPLPFIGGLRVSNVSRSKLHPSMRSGAASATTSLSHAASGIGSPHQYDNPSHYHSPPPLQQQSLANTPSYQVDSSQSIAGEISSTPSLSPESSEATRLANTASDTYNTHVTKCTTNTVSNTSNGQMATTGDVSSLSWAGSPGSHHQQHGNHPHTQTSLLPPPPFETQRTRTEGSRTSQTSLSIQPSSPIPPSLVSTQSSPCLSIVALELKGTLPALVVSDLILALPFDRLQLAYFVTELTAYAFTLRLTARVQDAKVYAQSQSQAHRIIKAAQHVSCLFSDWYRTNLLHLYPPVPNHDYSICDSYPSSLLLPATFTVADLKQVAQFRSKQRVPFISFVYSSSQSVLMRCSQPNSGWGNRSRHDETLINQIKSIANSMTVHSHGTHRYDDDTTQRHIESTAGDDESDDDHHISNNGLHHKTTAAQNATGQVSNSYPTTTNDDTKEPTYLPQSTTVASSSSHSLVSTPTSTSQLYRSASLRPVAHICRPACAVCKINAQSQSNSQASWDDSLTDEHSGGVISSHHGGQNHHPSCEDPLEDSDPSDVYPSRITSPLNFDEDIEFNKQQHTRSLLKSTTHSSAHSIPTLTSRDDKKLQVDDGIDHGDDHQSEPIPMSIQPTAPLMGGDNTSPYSMAGHQSSSKVVSTTSGISRPTNDDSPVFVNYSSSNPDTGSIPRSGSFEPISYIDLRNETIPPAAEVALLNNRGIPHDDQNLSSPSDDIPIVEQHDPSCPVVQGHFNCPESSSSSLPNSSIPPSEQLQSTGNRRQQPIAVETSNAYPRHTIPKLHAWQHQHKLIFFDCRPYSSALTNAFIGKGFEATQHYNASLEFLNIPNIHAMRRSYREHIKNIIHWKRVMYDYQIASIRHIYEQQIASIPPHATLPVASLASQSPTPSSDPHQDISPKSSDLPIIPSNQTTMARSGSSNDESIPYTGQLLAETILGSDWVRHQALILSSAVKVSQALINKVSCVVHCSDNFDRTTQLCLLVQVICDPYYRTLHGFCALFDREFFKIGHRICDRLLLGRSWSTTSWSEMFSNPFSGKSKQNALSSASSVSEYTPTNGESNPRYPTPIVKASNQATIETAASSSSSMKYPTPTMVPTTTAAIASPHAPRTISSATNATDGAQSRSSCPSISQVAKSFTSTLTVPTDLLQDKGGLYYEYSPIFIQLIECIYQLLRQFPTQFEFNERFLYDFCQSAFSGQFEMFEHNTDCDRPHEASVIFWSHFLSEDNLPRYLSDDYAPIPQPLIPQTQACDMRVWPEMYLNSPMLSYFKQYSTNDQDREARQNSNPLKKLNTKICPPFLVDSDTLTRSKAGKSEVYWFIKHNPFLNIPSPREKQQWYSQLTSLFNFGGNS